MARGPVTVDTAAALFKDGVELAERDGSHKGTTKTESTGMKLAERIYRRTNRLYDHLRSHSAVDPAHLEPKGGLDHLRSHRYCVLISYRQDSTPVATPLWFGVGEGRLYFRTGAPRRS